MGLFSWISNKFAKKTKWKNRDDELIETFSDNGFVILNTNIVVAENQKVMIIAKNRLTDVFSVGEYQLSPATLPVTNKRCKLSKGIVDKRTNSVVLPSKFEGYLLYLNTNDIKITNKSKQMKVKVKGVGKFNFKFVYEFMFHVENPTAFMKYFLDSGIKIKDKNFKGHIAYEVNRLLKRNLKNKITLHNLLLPDEKLDEVVLNEMTQSLSRMGVIITYFDVQDIVMSRRTNRRLSEKIEAGLVNLEYEDDVVKIEETNLTENIEDTDLGMNYNVEEINTTQESETIYKLPDINAIMGYSDNQQESPVEMKKRYCFYCGELLVDNSNFCHVCGTKQVNPKENEIN